ncbi:MAG TPA: DUF4012 domain-containing protein [Candidatus Paceibacterota bacterium]|nr:DUF4012 domain-containing protein [Candidatus Paceibacterota bacterium]
MKRRPRTKRSPKRLVDIVARHFYRGDAGDDEEDIKASDAVRIMESGPRDTLASFRKERARPSAVPPVGRLALIFLGGAALVVLSVGFVVYLSGRATAHRLAQEFQNIQAAVPDIQKGELGKARTTVQTADQNIANYLSGSSTGPFNIIDIGKNLGGLFQNIGGTYQDVRAVSSRLLSLLDKAGRLQSDWSNLLFKDKSGALLDLLKGARDDLAAINEAGDRLVSESNHFPGTPPFSPAQYLSSQIEISRARNFLDALIPYLETPGERRFIVTLNNPSELRPGGGFLGSYAELTLDRGAVQAVEVHDINEPDRQFTDKIIPPKPLQGLVTRWRAADSNWFFPFPDSAAKTLEFLEASDMYAASGTKFDGVIALTPRVVSDLLEITGPITLTGGDSTTTVDKDNFLMKIQEAVQAGQANRAPAPKTILSTLAPLLIERLADTPIDQEKFLDLVKDWADKRDVRIFLRDKDLEGFAQNYGLDGGVFEPAANANGDYLAVVNANVGGGKSDLFIDQKVLLQSQVNEDGSVGDHLVITRKHTAKSTDPWWYKETNWNYLELFVPEDSQLDIASGTLERTIRPLVNYAGAGYRADDDLKILEDSAEDLLAFPEVTVFKESDKTVFGSWSKTPAGKSSEITFDYAHNTMTPPADGVMYQFVAERQAGATGEFTYEISAPVGYRWKENGLPVYEYTTKDHPGRLILNLTFEKVL